MTDPLDRTDQEIVSALLRNGRASWRRIALAIGAQERTVARRGARLLDNGLVRVKGLSQAVLVERGENHFAKISCPPSSLREVSRWLANRKETLWVATLAGESAIISECYLQEDERSRFIEEELAQFPISDYSFGYVDRYRRTVRGWNPGVLPSDVLDLIGEDEERALLAASEAKLKDTLPERDEIDVAIADLLSADGRLGTDAIATELGIAKPTVRRRIEIMQQTDFLSIRAVVDPALLGFPVESLITVTARSNADLGRIGTVLAEDWRTRWAAEIPMQNGVQALVTTSSRHALNRFLVDVEDRLDSARVQVTANPLLTHYKRSDVSLLDSEA